MAVNKLVTPVLKWAGGKRQIIDQIFQHIQKGFSVYHEPFVGGGAVLFELQPKKAVINDINEELINVYKMIKADVEGLIEDLKKHKNDEQYFYDLRDQDRDIHVYCKLTPLQRASRLLFLNKTCYNGLFRVNKAGQFNAPFGNYKNPRIVNDITLRAVSGYFNKNDILFSSKDFSEALISAKKGDFVYLDPPYDPVSDSASFTGYDKGGFNKKEQIRLKDAIDCLDRKGIKFLLSNSSTDFIRDLYKDFKVVTIQAKRIINANPCKRGEINEVLVMNY